MQTPSGSCPPRTCATMGERCPMQSTTKRVRSSPPPLVDRTAAPGRTLTRSRGVFSRTTPPAASKRARAHATRRSGRTPTLSTSLSHTSSTPGKPHRTGLNSIPMTCSVASSNERMPASTSSITSLREAFQSCSRPRNSPASSTATRSPRSTSAVASKMPMLPPHTTTSKSGVSAAAFGSSKTTARGAGSSPERKFDHMSSKRSRAS